MNLQILNNKWNTFLNKIGFQDGHSVEHAIIQMIDQINNRFENNYFMLGVIIGLSKAFVTVEYSILIKN